MTLCQTQKRLAAALVATYEAMRDEWMNCPLCGGYCASNPKLERHDGGCELLKLMALLEPNHE